LQADALYLVFSSKLVDVQNG